MERILHYFPHLTVQQTELLSNLKPLYSEWNAKINVISRQDFDNFYIRHVLFSMSVARIISFIPGTTVADIGTGGGFPGIPLAILFPDTKFTLIDSIGKKIKVVEEITTALKLKNITTINTRSEKFNKKFDFILGRAVTAFPEFCQRNRHLLNPGNFNTLKNGIIYLTGGETDKSGLPRSQNLREWNLSYWFTEDFFQTKKILYISF